MENFDITFIYPAEGTQDRPHSPPFGFPAGSLDDAKRQADALIERESLHHRIVDVAVLTMNQDYVMEITRWVRNSGWIDV